MLFLEDEKNVLKGFVGNRFGLRAGLFCEFLNRCSKIHASNPVRVEFGFGRFGHAAKMKIGNESVQTLSYKAALRKNGAFSDG